MRSNEYMYWNGGGDHRRVVFRERRHHGYERVPLSIPGYGHLAVPPVLVAPPPVLVCDARWRERGWVGAGRGVGLERWDYGPEFGRNRHHLLPGYGKQGGWHVYPEQTHYAYPAPRYGNRFLEDDGMRPFGPRRDDRYAQSYKGNRGFSIQKEWKNPPQGKSRETSREKSRPKHGAWEKSSGRQQAVYDRRSVGSYRQKERSNSPMEKNQQQRELRDTCVSASDKQHDVNNLKSLDGVLMHDSHRSDSFGTVDEQHDNHQVRKESERNESGMSQEVDKETSSGTDWKPLKWSITGSLTCRGLVSDIISSRSVHSDCNDMRNDLPRHNAAPVESLLVDPSAFADDPGEMRLKKKPRLGWGEGLAKYEKKIVEGPDCHLDMIAETPCAPIMELSQPATSNVAEKSPPHVGSADGSFPMTISSLACSASPGLEDKTLIKVIDVENDANNMDASSVTLPEIENNVSSFLLEDFGPGPITNFSAMLAGLLHGEGQNPMDSGFGKSSAQDILMLWKRDITNAVESTEFEIDELENELKSLRSKPEEESLSPAPSGKQLQKQSNGLPRPPTEEVICSPSGEQTVDMRAPCANAMILAHADPKDEELHCSGTITSKFVEPPCFINSEPFAEQNHIFDVDTIDVKLPEPDCRPFDSLSDIEMLAGPLSAGNECPTIEENDWCRRILASNKVTASKACELLLKLPCDYAHKDVKLYSMLFGKYKLLVYNKLFLRKRSLKFKEKVLCLKYRAFQHSWKEKLRLLSAEKDRVKSQKKFDKCLRIRGGSHKHQSPISPRLASPAESSSLFPSANTVAFTSKLLSCLRVRVKRYRDCLKMPSLILDKNDKASRFISSNALVVDPCAVEKERALINAWTAEEKEVFIDKLAKFGNDFKRIASFLDHKTTADCVEFYYKNHKSESFQRTKKKTITDMLEMSLPANTYLVTSRKNFSREMSSASIGLLGEACEDASLVAAMSQSRKFRIKLKGVGGTSEKSRGYDDGNGRETAAADALAGISGSLSSEAVSSCITTSADRWEGNQDSRCQKVSSSSHHHPTPEATQAADEGNCSDESYCEVDPVDWTDHERSLFVQAFTTYGKDFLLISRRVRTKSRDQCKVFFSKARKRLGLEAPSNDACSSGSDGSDAFIVKAGSVLTSDKCGSMMYEDKEQEVISYEPAGLHLWSAMLDSQ
ncbi:Nuclear receptor corepressor 1-like protein [Drosera capensis]